MEGSMELPPKRHSYQVINSEIVSLVNFFRHTDQLQDLLRVIRKGPAVKNTVDEAIDQCSMVYNLRDSIEEARARAEEATDPQQKRVYASKGAFSCSQYRGSSFNPLTGLQNLRRYFTLIIFQAYLQSTEPDTMRSVESFETFVKNRPGVHFSILHF